MTAVATRTVDCMATARRILSSPVAVYSATPLEIVALAACTVRESTGEMPALPVIGDAPRAPASLAAAIARLLRAKGDGIAIVAASGHELAAADTEFHAAWAALQTIFEKEFPHGSNHPL